MRFWLPASRTADLIEVSFITCWHSGGSIRACGLKRLGNLSQLHRMTLLPTISRSSGCASVLASHFQVLLSVGEISGLPIHVPVRIEKTELNAAVDIRIMSPVVLMGRC